MEDIVKGLNVYLIGMMGAGKSTVGKRLAKKLQYRFVDTDNIIEQVVNTSISNIFAQVGEEGFRQLESDVLMQVSAYIRTVVSTGGGIVLRPKNWSFLNHGMIVYLDVPVDLLVQRLANDRSRPLLQEQDIKAKITQLYKEREHLYQQADIILPITPKDSVEDIVTEIITQIPAKIISHENN